MGMSNLTTYTVIGSVSLAWRWVILSIASYEELKIAPSPPPLISGPQPLGGPPHPLSPSFILGLENPVMSILVLSFYDRSVISSYPLSTSPYQGRGRRVGPPSPRKLNRHLYQGIWLMEGEGGRGGGWLQRRGGVRSVVLANCYLLSLAGCALMGHFPFTLLKLFTQLYPKFYHKH